MYKQNRMQLTTATSKNIVDGETIETKMERIIANKEPVKDGAPPLYTERKEGVRASTNIRTDKFEIAIDASNKIAKSYKARREDLQKKNNGGPESTQGKDQGTTTEPTK